VPDSDHGPALDRTVPKDPPGAWPPARRLARLATAPVEKFLAIEASSGLLLLLVTAIALGWANSRWSESYVALWHTPLGFQLGPLAFERDLHFWINDGLMAIFFFVVGLEIRREMYRGELSELRRAALPLAAALGGMIVPACVFLALNQTPESRNGWGVPMATDIAFAVGVLTLLGRRVPPALRILLLALAVIDDVGAILVIAIFYSTDLSLTGFAVAAGGVGMILGMQLIGLRYPLMYLLPALLVWAGLYAGGVHPTLAGVAVGLLTPARAWLGPRGFAQHAEGSVAALRRQGSHDEHAAIPHLAHLDEARREAISPVESIQHALHGWVAFGIMPLFALANAGVPLGAAALEGTALNVFLGVTLGLALGKPVGIVAFSWLFTRLGVARLPAGMNLMSVAVVGVVGGVGFTMALFIAQLAFPPGPLLETAKLGILTASAAAALGSYLLGRAVLPQTPSPEAAQSEVEAESSTLA